MKHKRTEFKSHFDSRWNQLIKGRAAWIGGGKKLHGMSCTVEKLFYPSLKSYHDYLSKRKNEDGGIITTTKPKSSITRESSYPRTLPGQANILSSAFNNKTLSNVMVGGISSSTTKPREQEMSQLITQHLASEHLLPFQAQVTCGSVPLCLITKIDFLCKNTQTKQWVVVSLKHRNFRYYQAYTPCYFEKDPFKKILISMYTADQLDLGVAVFLFAETHKIQWTKITGRLLCVDTFCNENKIKTYELEKWACDLERLKLSFPAFL